MYHRYHIMYATSICLRVGSNNSSSAIVLLKPHFFLQSCSFCCCCTIPTKKNAGTITSRQRNPQPTKPNKKSRSPKSPSVPFSVESSQPKTNKNHPSLSSSPSLNDLSPFENCRCQLVGNFGVNSLI